ncbi:MAG: helix-turn-helix transcriptional regulator [Candidatus Paceibacteria bacterium]
MENKKLGTILVIFGLIFLALLIYFTVNLNAQQDSLNCNPSQGCVTVDKKLSWTHVGFGFFGFMLALGFYILFFNKTEEKILKKLEDDKNNQVSEKKFEWILNALDSQEKSVMKAVKEQDGITQNTLRLRTDLSKAKLCYVLQELEKRNLIKREEKGKTMQVFLKV